MEIDLPSARRSLRTDELGLHFSPRGEAKCVRLTRHESRNTAFTHRARQASATKSWRSYHVLRPSCGVKCRLGPGASRAPLSCKSCVCMAVRFAVSVQESQHQKPPPGPAAPAAWSLLPTTARYCPASCRPVTASVPTMAHDGSLLPGFLLPLSKCPRTVSRSRSASRGAVIAAAPVASGLLGPRRTQHEPMLRKGNVLDCTNRGLSILR